MKALRLFGPRDLRVVEEAMPEPAPGEALLRVSAVTVCHSDIHYYRYGRIGDTVSDVPLVLGHEFSGKVIEVRPEYSRASPEYSRTASEYSRTASDVGRVRPGDLVAVEPAVSCGHCRYCREGNPNLCQNLLFAGIPPMDGGLREYVTYRPEFLFPLPPGMTAEQGALVEPLGVALHAWDLAKPRVGESVAVVGCGPIGLLLVQIARIAGAAPILAVEPLAYRRDLASELGAVALSPDDDLTARAEALTGGHGVDVAIEAAGTMPAQEEAVRIVKRGGRVVLVGIPPEDQVAMTHHVARRKGLTIKVARRMKLIYPRAILLVQRGMIHLDSLWSRIACRWKRATAPFGSSRRTTRGSSRRW
jgi:L-iditol 2-dehydrogenase